MITSLLLMPSTPVTGHGLGQLSSADGVRPWPSVAPNYSLLVGCHCDLMLRRILRSLAIKTRLGVVILCFPLSIVFMQLLGWHTAFLGLWLGLDQSSPNGGLLGSQPRLAEWISSISVVHHSHVGLGHFFSHWESYLLLNSCFFLNYSGFCFGSCIGAFYVAP